MKYSQDINLDEMRYFRDKHNFNLSGESWLSPLSSGQTSAKHIFACHLR